jgi:hypothetical protein
MACHKSGKITDYASQSLPLQVIQLTLRNILAF